MNLKNSRLDPSLTLLKKSNLNKVIICSKLNQENTHLLLSCRGQANSNHEILSYDIASELVTRFLQLPASSLGYSDLEIISNTTFVVNQDNGRVSAFSDGEKLEGVLLPFALLGLNSFSNTFCRVSRGRMAYISKSKRDTLVVVHVRNGFPVVSLHRFEGYRFTHVAEMRGKLYCVSHVGGRSKILVIKPGTMKLQVARDMAQSTARPTTLNCGEGIVAFSDEKVGWGHSRTFSQYSMAC